MATPVIASRPMESMNNLVTLLLSRRNGQLESGTHEKIQIRSERRHHVILSENTEKLHFKTPKVPMMGSTRKESRPDLYMLLVSMRKQLLESDTHKKKNQILCLLQLFFSGSTHRQLLLCADPSPSCEAILDVITKMKPGSTQVRAASQMTSAERNGR
jgi:hypothetical protein